ncbi:MAG TPA: hypothetical protein VLA82_01945 [Actinomycetota bacterium]|nr:hypothetical protein [Actinomycetota bacterium]
MVRRAVVPAVAGMALAAALGWLVDGADAAWSAAVGVAIVAANFAAHGLSLAWASTISVSAVFAVALGGFVVRLGVVVAAMFALNTLDPFSPVAFALAVVPATILLLAFEARLVTRGVGATLEIPADPAAARAGSALAAREAR